MDRRSTGNSKLQLLSALQVLHAPEGDLNDGGGLLLRVRGDSSSWVLRYTASTGKRREMGLGVADRGSLKRAGASLEQAREQAAEARKLLKQGADPIDDRQRKREADRVVEDQQKANRAREQMTLARAARGYHERVVEPRLTTKHAAQWIASLEHHVPESIWHKPIDQIPLDGPFPPGMEILAGDKCVQKSGFAHGSQKRRDAANSLELPVNRDLVPRHKSPASSTRTLPS